MKLIQEKQANKYIIATKKSQKVTETRSSYMDESEVQPREKGRWGSEKKHELENPQIKVAFRAMD